MAWVILAKEIWTKQIKKPTSDNLEKLMNVELLEKAANSIVKAVQLKSFGEEIKVLSANSDNRIGVTKSSKFCKLDPFLDSDGLLQVGGRLGKSRLSHSEGCSLYLFIFLFAFTPCKAEQSLQGMELQEKETQKD